MTVSKSLLLLLIINLLFSTFHLQRWFYRLIVCNTEPLSCYDGNSARILINDISKHSETPNAPSIPALSHFLSLNTTY
jgi:hypothetical protein